ncbi:hypothetical protein K450DRAFT_272084 [Umbelopsis ramanniana AG]|uniref:SGF29 C-terminal domain-containing protein n=1 Tax=Umbelopsis ramanniana AG TaxID=1314678 RepID=A0AAD5HE84_UMBRA|nr:uncharacterized protein K450DRAFT_272084 [Umbelopsis ramanniana AG]KAI8579301.1 hypothetical protein K450DRAFT_272084 [Umbelopsis ramanniana AG]
MDRKSRASRAASLDETNEEVSLWKQICSSLLKLENVQKESEPIITSVNKLHMTIESIDAISPSTSYKLKELYSEGITTSISESKTITDVIEKLSVLIALRDASESASDPRRKKRKTEADDLKITSGPHASKKSKLTNGGIIPVGAAVAAKQPKQKDKTEEWILAVVISYNSDKNKYHVEDVDQDETGTRQKYLVPPKNVIPIPSVAEVRQLPEIPAHTDVLALYPGTTCFYNAIVVTPPSKNKDSASTGQYKVQFEDDNDETKVVTPIHVLEKAKSK